MCDLSGSAFAARFAARVGMPPATYLAFVRLDAAATLLRDTALPVAHIAERIGYTSEAAFNRAFKNRGDQYPLAGSGYWSPDGGQWLAALASVRDGVEIFTGRHESTAA